jgi:hypothetical protein
MTSIQHFLKEKPSVLGIRCIPEGSISLRHGNLWCARFLEERAWQRAG